MIIKDIFNMKNAYEKYIQTKFYLEDLEWLKNDLKFYAQIKTQEIKEIYKPHLELEITQLKKLKDIIKNYE